MAEEEQPTDIKPGHFAKRESDRGDKGWLLRLFESLDEPTRQELLRFAQDLAERPRAG